MEAGVSLDEFLEDFPTVSKEKAVALLDQWKLMNWSGKARYNDSYLKKLDD